jgi:hypothetical protein
MLTFAKNLFKKQKKCHQNWDIANFLIFATIEKYIFVLTLMNTSYLESGSDDFATTWQRL